MSPSTRAKLNSHIQARDVRLPLEIAEIIWADHVADLIHDTLSFAVTATLDYNIHPIPASSLAAPKENKTALEGARRSYDVKVKRRRRQVRVFRPVLHVAHSTHQHRRVVENVLKKLLPVGFVDMGYRIKWTVPFSKVNPILNDPTTHALLGTLGILQTTFDCFVQIMEHLAVGHLHEVGVLLHDLQFENPLLFETPLMRIHITNAKARVLLHSICVYDQDVRSLLSLEEWHLGQQGQINWQHLDAEEQAMADLEWASEEEDFGMAWDEAFEGGLGNQSAGVLHFEVHIANGIDVNDLDEDTLSEDNIGSDDNDETGNGGIMVNAIVHDTSNQEDEEEEYWSLFRDVKLLSWVDEAISGVNINNHDGRFLYQGSLSLAHTMKELVLATATKELKWIFTICQDNLKDLRDPWFFHDDAVEERMREFDGVLNSYHKKISKMKSRSTVLIEKLLPHQGTKEIHLRLLRPVNDLLPMSQKHFLKWKDDIKQFKWDSVMKKDQMMMEFADRSSAAVQSLRDKFFEQLAPGILSQMPE